MIKSFSEVLEGLNDQDTIDSSDEDEDNEKEELDEKSMAVLWTVFILKRKG